MPWVPLFAVLAVLELVPLGLELEWLQKVAAVQVTVVAGLMLFAPLFTPVEPLGHYAH